MSVRRDRRILGGIAAGAEIILPPYGDEWLAPGIYAAIAYGKRDKMVDVTETMRRGTQVAEEPMDTSITKRMMIIAGAALLLLVLIHLGFLGRVLA